MADDDGGRGIKLQASGIAQLVVILAVVVVAVYFARAPSGVSIAEDEPAARVRAAPTVGVVRPLPTQAAQEIRTTGLVTAEAGLAIRSQLPGEVVFVSPSLRPGGSFAAGQPLLRIEREDYEIHLESAQAVLRQMQARLKKQRLKGEARRARFLRENPGAEVPPLVDRIPQIEKAQARVDRAENAVRAAEIALARTTIALPFDGWVRTGGVQVGQIAHPGAELGLVFAKDAVQIETRISLANLAALGAVVGRTATADAGGTMFEVEVLRISAAVDLESRLATLYLAFADDVDIEALPRPGTFAEVVLEGSPMEGVFVLPEAAEQAGGSVWIVERGALKSFQPRSLGRTAAGWLVRAFEAGQGVVVGKVPAARPGLPVEPVPARDSL